MTDGSKFEICDHKCSSSNCDDESSCNGFQRGVGCLELVKIFDGYTNCDKGADERDCEVTNTTLHTCPHHWTGRLVPILNYTKCAAFERKGSSYHYPYCRNFYEQSNCSDIERIGGPRCLIDGYMFSVSIFVVCDSDLSKNNQYLIYAPAEKSCIVK